MGRFSSIVTPSRLSAQVEQVAPADTPSAKAQVSQKQDDTQTQEDARSLVKPVDKKTDRRTRARSSQTKEQRAKDDALYTKRRLHNRLIDDLDLSILDKLDENEMRKQIHARVKDIVKSEHMKLNTSEIQELAAALINEMTGLGPLEPLLDDESISDILVNTHEHVFVERGGELEPTTVRFADEAHLLRIINKIVSAVGRRVDESHPMADARLADGSRVNVAVAPIAVDGPLMSIRKFSSNPFTLDKLVDFGAAPEVVAEFLWAACKAKVTILISGGTGSGKTTLLNALSQSISHKERLITIEDAAELQLQQPHVARMETRPPNIEGNGEIKQRELVKNALRMRPDRVILGEVRGEEAFDMLQAMNTGHEGSLATLHANTPRDAITRLEQMVGMGDMKISPEGVAGQIASAVGLIVQASRLSDGQRKITSVSEVTGMEGPVIQMQEIFNYTKTGSGPNYEVIGEFRATGIRPQCLHEILTSGSNLDQTIFEPGVLEIGRVSERSLHERMP